MHLSRVGADQFETCYSIRVGTKFDIDDGKLWHLPMERYIRSVNINERIANEKAEIKNSLRYVATFSNAFIISVYLYMYIYQIEHTAYLCYKRMTN